MPKLVNRAKMTTATTGTGTLTLGSAVAGYQTFANAGVANSNIVRYTIEDGSAWEIGLGTYSSTGTTLTRGTIESSTGTAINLSGNATVFVTAAAADLQELVTFAETFALPTVDGTNGQVLSTNGAGTLTFSTISGGATDINGLSDGYSDGSSVGLGNSALQKDDGTQNYNTAVGTLALGSVVSGSNNTAVGAFALRNGAASGINSTAVGREALDNFVGNLGTAVGYQALTGASGGLFTGTSNVGIGYQTGYDLSTGAHNFLGGYQAGTNLTTASNNVAIGNGALDAATTGGRNIAIGLNAMGAGIATAASGNNVAIGVTALNAITSGTDNTAVGNTAGSTLTTGANNTLLGNGAAASSATVSNEITLGNSSITTLRCQVTTITSLSDARDKTDIQPLNAGLEFVEALNPVSFTWNMRDGGKVGEADTGFIAQDLQSAQADTGVTIPGLVYDVNPDKLEAGYGKLIPVLVQAIKDLSAEVKTLKAQLEAK